MVGAPTRSRSRRSCSCPTARCTTTMHNNLTSAVTKLEACNRVDAVRIADEAGWLQPTGCGRPAGPPNPYRQIRKAGTRARISCSKVHAAIIHRSTGPSLLTFKPQHPSYSLALMVPAVALLCRRMLVTASRSTGANTPSAVSGSTAASRTQRHAHGRCPGRFERYRPCQGVCATGADPLPRRRVAGPPGRRRSEDPARPPRPLQHRDHRRHLHQRPARGPARKRRRHRPPRPHRGPPCPQEDQEQGPEQPARPAAENRWPDLNITGPSLEGAGQDAETREGLTVGGGTHIAPT